MSDFSILPVALFAGMMASFMAVMLFAVLTDRDIAS
jgi:N-acetylglutamate synthase/N-acetylornithine aminotransferase